MLAMSYSDAGALIQKLGPHLDTIALVVNDPSFPSLMDRIKTLNAIEAGSAAGSSSSGGSSAPSAANVGVGLRYGVMGLDAVIYARRNPWAVGVVGAGAVLFLLSIGFAMGSRRRK